jgi:cell division initiation protein
MALTPLDIQNKSFQTKMRGYNQDEVDDFLDMIVRDYEAVLQDNREMEKAIKHSEEKLEYFNELKDALNQSIIVAQDTADKVKTSASKESEVLVTSAQNKADELIANAEKRAYEINHLAEEKAKELLTEATAQARQLANETNDLKSKTRVFHQQLMLLVQSQLEQTKAPEWEEVLKPLSTYVDDSDSIIKEVLGKELDTPTTSSVDSETEVSFDDAAADSFTIEMPEVITTPDAE